MARRLDRQHQAGADGAAVQQDGAAAADPVLTAYVGAGEAEVVTQVVGEQATDAAGRRPLDAVDLHAAARWTSVRTRCSLNSGVDSRSALG